MHRCSQPGTFFHRCQIQDRQHSGHAAADRADIGVWQIIPRICFAAAKDLCGCVQLDVGFKPNHGFIFSHRLILHIFQDLRLDAAPGFLLGCLLKGIG